MIKPQPDTGGHLARWLSAEFRPYRGRSVDPGKPVKVYRCLRPGRARYSIMQGRLVVGHADRLMLRQVQPQVWPTVCARIAADGRKRVAGMLHGHITGSGMGLAWDSGRDGSSESRLPERYRFSAGDAAFMGGVTQTPQPLRGALVAMLDAAGLSAALTT